VDHRAGRLGWGLRDVELESFCKPCASFGPTEILAIPVQPMNEKPNTTFL
jgi:hypothetical protein